MKRRCVPALLPAILVMLVVAGGGAAVAQSSFCPDNREVAADAVIDKVTSWTALQRWQRRYGGCDDGETAEAVDDVVATLLVRRWNELMRSADAVESDAGFRSFLLRHIDEVALDDPSVKRIRAFTRDRCMPGNLRLCSRIRSALDRLDRKSGG